MRRQLEAEFEQVSPGRVSIQLRETTQNLKLGYVEVVLNNEGGTTVRAWNGDDDSPCLHEIDIRGEKPGA